MVGVKEFSSGFENGEVTAAVLIEALPYIHELEERIIVVKIGGSVLNDPERFNLFAKDILLIKSLGMKIIIVHGGGPAINKIMTKQEVSFDRINGERVTTPETMEVVSMALNGIVNKTLVRAINAIKPKAVGLSGEDGFTVLSDIKDEKLMRVGNILQVNTKLLNTLLEADFIPVMSVTGTDFEGGQLNHDADIFAAKIATSLMAEKLVYISDVGGVLKDVSDEGTRISKVEKSEIDNLFESGIVEGNFIPKMKSILDALEVIPSVHMLDGRMEHSLILELLTKGGSGTFFYNKDLYTLES
jgi:acetylglutamate kinase